MNKIKQMKLQIPKDLGLSYAKTLSSFLKKLNYAGLNGSVSSWAWN